MARGKSVKDLDLFNQQTLKAPKLVQMGKLLYRWFTAAQSKGTLITWLIITKKTHSFNDFMKVTDKCKFSNCSNSKLPVRTRAIKK
jgi:hypothetical protein